MKHYIKNRAEYTYAGSCENMNQNEINSIFLTQEHESDCSLLVCRGTK